MPTMAVKKAHLGAKQNNRDAQSQDKDVLNRIRRFRFAQHLWKLRKLTIGASIHLVVKEGRKGHQNANKTGKRLSNGFKWHPIVFQMLITISLHAVYQQDLFPNTAKPPSWCLPMIVAKGSFFFVLCGVAATSCCAVANSTFLHVPQDVPRRAVEYL